MHRQPLLGQPSQCQGQSPGPDIFAFFRISLCWVLVVLLVLVTHQPAEFVSAQDEAALMVSVPDLTHFPRVDLSFSLPDSHSQLTAGLSSEQVVVFENDNAITPTSLDKKDAGLRFGLIINGGRDLDLRDTAGASLFNHLTGALNQWAVSPAGSEVDTWSLITPEGVLVDGIVDQPSWTKSLTAYQPNFRHMTPDLTSLIDGIEQLRAVRPDFGERPVLLYLTPPPTADQIDPMAELSAQARAAGIRVDVWMVGDPLYLANDQGGALMHLAANTGGSFTHYFIGQPLPDLHQYLAGLGAVYQLTYPSSWRETGDHHLTLHIDTPGGGLRGDSPSVYLQLLPPNPVLVSPPHTIIRQQTAAADGGAPVLMPDEQSISVLVEFPDRHPRAIVSSRLLLDGNVVQENNLPPFEIFQWNLSSLVETADHTLAVEVTDELGLSTVTHPAQIRVEIDQPLPSVHRSAAEWALILAVGLAGLAVIVLVVWLAPGLLRIGRKLVSSPAHEPLVSAPVEDDAPVSAFLIPLHSLLEQPDPQAFSITTRTTRVGGDAEAVDLPIPDSPWDAILAEITFQEGVYRLQEIGTQGLVFLNYEAVGSQPVDLKSGDVLHFGNCGFRFTINSDIPNQVIRVDSFQPYL